MTFAQFAAIDFAAPGPTDRCEALAHSLMGENRPAISGARTSSPFRRATQNHLWALPLINKPGCA
jgi:hypothetical protein